MQGLSEFINKTMQEWKVPGLGIAIITDTKGNIASLTVPLEPTVKEIVFTRIPESN